MTTPTTHTHTHIYTEDIPIKAVQMEDTNKNAHMLLLACMEGFMGACT